MCVSKSVAYAHAVNPIKEQHTRLRVTEQIQKLGFTEPYQGNASLPERHAPAVAL